MVGTNLYEKNCRQLMPDFWTAHSSHSLQSKSSPLLPSSNPDLPRHNSRELLGLFGPQGNLAISAAVKPQVSDLGISELEIQALAAKQLQQTL